MRRRLRDGTEPARESHPVDRDRRTVRTIEDIAAIETTDMAPGCEHLNVELDQD